MLLILLPSIPLLGAFALLAVGDKDVNMPFIASSITLSLAGWGLRGVFRGEQLTYTLPFSGPYSPTCLQYLCSWLHFCGGQSPYTRRNT